MLAIIRFRLEYVANKLAHLGTEYPRCCKRSGTEHARWLTEMSSLGRCRRFSPTSWRRPGRLSRTTQRRRSRTRGKILRKLIIHEYTRGLGHRAETKAKYDTCGYGIKKIAKFVTTMPPLVLQQAKTYQSPYREAEVLLPFTRTGYTAQVAGPAPKRPRVECITPETGTVMLQGNGYVVPSSFLELMAVVESVFSRDDKCLPPRSLFMLRSEVYRRSQVLIIRPSQYLTCQI
jgi:hypothetical protein